MSLTTLENSQLPRYSDESGFQPHISTQNSPNNPTPIIETLKTEVSNTQNQNETTNFDPEYDQISSPGTPKTLEQNNFELVLKTENGLMQNVLSKTEFDENCCKPKIKK